MSSIALEKQNQNTPNSKQGEMIKIKAEINEIRLKKTIKGRSGSLNG